MDPLATDSPGDQTAMTDEAWQSVLRAVDQTYSELVAHQERLEDQNAELSAAKRLIESVMASVSDILIVIDRDGTVAEASASLRGLVGGEAGAVIGQPATGVFDTAGAELLAAALGRLRLHHAVTHFEASIPTETGAQPFDIALSPRIDARDRFAGAVLSGRPLGELRRAYAELELSHEQLKQAQSQIVRNEKLASLGRLLAGVAHELNNPISFVYASVHALEKYVGQFETYFQQVQSGAPREDLVRLRNDLKLERALGNLSTAIHGAREGAERVRDIVADLRRLSSEGSGERVAFDLAETARVGARWVERGSKTGVAVTFSGEEALRVCGVPGHVQQIVMNLVQNAIDAVDGVPDPAVRIDLDRAAGMARLTVSDNGPGIPEAQRAAVFDPFFTTKPVGKGTGLGLSISAKIADEHGGQLSLLPGPGAVFLLELPLAHEPGES
ncbi:MAG: PAS domain-containing sensor histidine kinase [Rhodobacteraceae bacterium]|jgi:two-component system sensor histidine kinase HupT/HoxJ|uniref:histidine kinase n=1 Tax=Salipiger profundus TaxID=1229727 RepID=A0A1U7D4D2_9RHOB|nr:MULTISPECIES: ATP-binding protein [Salipiger]APX23011.1 PAS domain-containing protein [Salipiger profundus]MAB04674.1 PAS domain-containing sensor histidine kinase [Paracoccaceae bacterium]GGA12683.1 PAS domain-containing sensor histidine kinase [Salipiger profundus]SFD21402.1 two-component system, NtrC family, sensor histidine kinase HupT/HoxJ [Salipiger profundus]